MIKLKHNKKELTPMGIVKIYCYNCDKLRDRELFERCYAAAGEQRKAKIDRLRFNSDKRLSLGADILFRHALGEWADKPVKTNEYGKPYIEGCPIFFNLSHSGSIAMIAVSDTEIGCDVQITSKPPLEVAQRYFCESERILIEQSNDRAKMFFRLWTLKESYIKMLGKGLSAPLDSFEVQFKNGTPFITADCSAAEFDISAEYCAAVCIKGNAVIDPPIKL